MFNIIRYEVNVNKVQNKSYIINRIVFWKILIILFFLKEFQNIISVGTGMDKLEILFIVVEKLKWCNCYEIV